VAQRWGAEPARPPV